MTVAGIAWERMTPQARTRAISLLMRNPDYQTWVEGFPAAEQGRIAFMEAATWPDDLRGRTCKIRPRQTAFAMTDIHPPTQAPISTLATTIIA